MEGRMTMGLLISLETVRVGREVETASFGMTLHNYHAMDEIEERP